MTNSRAFILSDCEYPQCEEKPYALLTVNPTKGDNFIIAQTEQRQHAFNSHVNLQNQNVYRWPLELFPPHQGTVESVNIEKNLEHYNLFTLTFVDSNEGNQYNLESWFNCHESGYKYACNALRSLKMGKQKMTKVCGEYSS